MALSTGDVCGSTTGSTFLSRVRAAYGELAPKERLTFWVTILSTLCSALAVLFAAKQVYDFAWSLQLQQTLAIIDDGQRVANDILSDAEAAEIVRSNDGTVEQRQKVNLKLANYNAAIVKFSLLQDQGVVGSNFGRIFLEDFCKLYKRPFFRGWWEERKRTDSFAGVSPSYRNMDRDC